MHACLSLLSCLVDSPLPYTYSLCGRQSTCRGHRSAVQPLSTCAVLTATATRLRPFQWATLWLLLNATAHATQAVVRIFLCIVHILMMRCSIVRGGWGGRLLPAHVLSGLLHLSPGGAVTPYKSPRPASVGLFGTRSISSRRHACAQRSSREQNHWLQNFYRSVAGRWFAELYR